MSGINLRDLAELQSKYRVVRLYDLLKSNGIEITSLQEYGGIENVVKALNLLLKKRGLNVKLRAQTLQEMLAIPEEELEKLVKLYRQLEGSKTGNKDNG